MFWNICHICGIKSFLRSLAPPLYSFFIMLFAEKGMDVMLIGVVEKGSIYCFFVSSPPPPPTQSTFVTWPLKLICVTGKKLPICNNNFLVKIYFFKMSIWKYDILLLFRSWLLPSPSTMGLRNNVFVWCVTPVWP